MSEIQITSVRKDFKGHQALKSINLDVKDQEFCVLLGPSGCGKTTLMRIIAGLETETSGDIMIGGKRMNGLPPRERNIAMVFQNYAVFPHMTIAQNIGFGLKMKKVPEDQAKKQVYEAAELMHIEHLLERYAGQLSGGQRQRVAVARALAVRPDVLLMDEPLSNLDALLRLEMRSELKGLLRDLKTTTIYVTHDQTEAMSLADRIAVMYGGEIVQYDAPPKVYTDPASSFVGGFIGNPPMNFISNVETQRALGLSAPHAQAKTLGIRPEDLELANDGLEINAKVVEMLGASQQINSKAGDELIRVSVAANPIIAPGSSIRVRARASQARWYDAQGKLVAA
ncbi:ABC transporter ATP-binding protein [Variovorax sp. PCZ-1]|uniref:ABC transporter ATP-binding protein n=1 Tax=Variovorax sp. PCZ-1 TaxID=2835533 RepID=UPI001BCEB878|nr:ABC transporter ATP-binding protein [Variovorax sp. PCZ-1]MBS7806098.1 ABC transporter ATP-binding protein [Variovorax sp. PCZ-1]